MKKAVFMGLILITSLANAVTLNTPKSIQTFLEVIPQASTDMLPFIISNGSVVKSIEIKEIKQGFTSSQILCQYTYVVNLQNKETSGPIKAKKIITMDEENRYCPYNP